MPIDKAANNFSFIGKKITFQRFSMKMVHPVQHKCFLANQRMK